MGKVVSELLIGRFTTVINGGTKTKINLSRPWQPPLPIAPEKCPFCTKSEEEIPLSGKPEGWRFLSNPFTPHQHHRLIIPSTCWNAEKLQTLGGVRAIRDALTIARLATRDENVETATYIHIGSSAGQNLGHAHWHLMEVPVESRSSVQSFFVYANCLCIKANILRSSLQAHVLASVSSSGEMNN